VELSKSIVAIAFFVTSALPGCAPARAPNAAAIAPTTLTGSDGKSHPLIDPDAKLTVVEFFSAHCPCQAKHDERLQALARTYRSRGVAFVAVDSEIDAAVDRDRTETEARRYAYPILIDSDGAVARRLGADYATFTVLVDHAGKMLYSGGIDSDKSHLTGDATPYLRDAIDDALEGRPLRRASAKALGCALTLR